MAEEEKKEEPINEAQGKQAEEQSGTGEPEEAAVETQAAQPSPAEGEETVEAPAAQEPVAEPSPEPPAVGGGKKIIFIALLVLVLGLGAVVAGFMSARRARQERETGPAPTQAPVEEDTLASQYEQQSSSDEVEDINKDLMDTSFEGIDAELADIDKELSAED